VLLAFRGISDFDGLHSGKYDDEVRLMPQPAATARLAAGRHDRRNSVGQIIEHRAAREEKERRW
jgi:hypothetical protein